MTRLLVSALLLGAFAVTPVLAQNARPPQPPLPPAPAGSTAPMAIAPDQVIPLDQALAAAQTALDTCMALPKKSTAAVAVFDLNGNYRVALSADDTGLPFYDYARRKAYTVLKKGMSSGDFGKSLGTVARGAVIEGDANLINWAGAEPIKKNGKIIGVLSVSGPTGMNDDEMCTMAGMAKFHL